MSNKGIIKTMCQSTMDMNMSRNESWKVWVIGSQVVFIGSWVAFIGLRVAFICLRVIFVGFGLGRSMMEWYVTVPPS